jgi:phenylacetate-CoA ligase
MANDQMQLLVETTETAPGFALQVIDALREVTKLRGEVQMVSPAACPTTAR